MSEYRFDQEKAADNRRKHGVGFDDAVAALLDPLGTTWFDAGHSAAEPRYVTVGRDVKGRLLAVVTSEGDRGGRIISARRATKRERYAYKERTPFDPI